MSVSIVQYNNEDLPQMIRIWNDIVQEGISFPEEQILNPHSGKSFFGAQTYCAVAKNNYGDVLGLYILHPNNVGRCGHICNASYAVNKDSRGHHIGEKLVIDSLKHAKHLGFRILQFNAVVESNVYARHLYEKLGFVQLGTIPEGFRMKDGTFANTCSYYHKL